MRVAAYHCPHCTSLLFICEGETTDLCPKSGCRAVLDRLSVRDAMLSAWDIFAMNLGGRPPSSAFGPLPKEPKSFADSLEALLASVESIAADGGKPNGR